jgi:hypothetical protein
MARNLPTTLIGATFIGMALLGLHSDRLVSRGGLSGITRESYPVLFWSFTVFLLVAGVGAMISGLIKREGDETPEKARIVQARNQRWDEILSRIDKVFFYTAIVLVLASVAWIFIAELIRTGSM